MRFSHSCFMACAFWWAVPLPGGRAFAPLPSLGAPFARATSASQRYCRRSRQRSFLLQQGSLSLHHRAGHVSLATVPPLIPLYFGMVVHAARACAHALPHTSPKHCSGPFPCLTIASTSLPISSASMPTAYGHLPSASGHLHLKSWHLPSASGDLPGRS